MQVLKWRILIWYDQTKIWNWPSENGWPLKNCDKERLTETEEDLFEKIQSPRIIGQKHPLLYPFIFVPFWAGLHGRNSSVLYRQAKLAWIGEKWSDTWSFSESAFEVEFGVLSIYLWCIKEHYAWLVFYILLSCDISIIFKIINKESHVLHCI